MKARNMFETKIRENLKGKESTQLEKISSLILVANITRNNTKRDNTRGLLTKQKTKLVDETTEALEEIQYHNCATFRDIKDAVKAQAEEMRQTLE